MIVVWLGALLFWALRWLIGLTLAAGFLLFTGANAFLAVRRLERLFNDVSDIRQDVEVGNQILKLLTLHGVKSVAVTKGIFGLGASRPVYR